MLVFDADADAGTLREIYQPLEALGDAVEALGLERIRLAQEGEDAEQVAVEGAGHVEAAFENLAMGLGAGGIVELAFEDRRRAAEDFPAIFIGGRPDRRHVFAGQILERAAGETAQFDPRQFELAHEGAEDRQVLGNFIGDERKGVRECHGFEKWETEMEAWCRFTSWRRRAS